MDEKTGNYKWNAANEKMVAIIIRLTKEERRALKMYAAEKEQSIQQLLQAAVQEIIRNERDGSAK